MGLMRLRTRPSVHQQQSRLSYGDPTQPDCIDDSVNTWTYFATLAHDGLLRYYTVAGFAHRGSLLTLDFSNATVLVEKGDGEQFAVDP
jgi:hypothetical protein